MAVPAVCQGLYVPLSAFYNYFLTSAWFRSYLNSLREPGSDWGCADGVGRAGLCRPARPRLWVFLLRSVLRVARLQMARQAFTLVFVFLVRASVVAPNVSCRVQHSSIPSTAANRRVAVCSDPAREPRRPWSALRPS